MAKTQPAHKESVIVDCNYTFDQAIAGTKAPRGIINHLKLIKVQYYSTDGKIHQGQVLTNKIIAEDVGRMFRFMLHQHFPVERAVPVVKYNWDDNLSMKDNNSYSFCYRNVSFSKHARGMAIDINPYFNPVRYKPDSVGHRRSTIPRGAVYDRNVEGTFYNSHPVVQEFVRLGFRWGHTFSNKYDDHHFEK